MCNLMKRQPQFLEISLKYRVYIQTVSYDTIASELKSR